MFKSKEIDNMFDQSISSIYIGRQQNQTWYKIKYRIYHASQSFNQYDMINSHSIYISGHTNSRSFNNNNIYLRNKLSSTTEKN